MTNRLTLGYTAMTAVITAAMIDYVSASPFVLHDSPATYSLTFASYSPAVAVGSIWQMAARRQRPRC